MTTPELPSLNFQPRVYGVGAWTDNLFFAYDLVALTRPATLVELGVDRGESYFAFCQSALENATTTRCFGVDLWTGDQHVGGYDETTFREVERHNAAQYAAFSTLLRMSFDDALPQFADDTIDVLHIDGRHVEEAIRHDVERWLPKLRPGGILLMHDVGVRTRGFGVWRVWEYLQTRGRSYTFEQWPGLGVWQKPPPTALSSPVELLFSGPVDECNLLVSYYRDRAAETQRRIAEDWRSGRVRHTAIGNQTTVQVFHSVGGSHAEENSVLARIGHGDWKSIALKLPAGAGAAPLRIDFVSPFTTIDIESLAVRVGTETLFHTASAAEFDRVRLAGDCLREPAPSGLRLQITGIDPQLYLPSLRTGASGECLIVEMRLRVSVPTASNQSAAPSAARPSPSSGGA